MEDSMPDREEEPDLVRLVRLLVASATTGSREDFYRGLVASRVRFTAKGLAGKPKGPYSVSASDHVEIPNARGTDGLLYMAVYADSVEELAADTTEPIGEIDARTLLGIARDAGIGVMVMCGHGPDPCWVAVPRTHVDALLSLAPPGPPPAARDTP
jgi:hypothetical protein